MTLDTVLLASSDAELCASFCELLQRDPSRQSIRIIEEKTLEGALKFLRDDHPLVDAVVVGTELFDTNGDPLHAVRHIVSAAPLVPVLVASDPDDLDLARKCIRVGAEDYIQPTMMDEGALWRRLAFALERKRGAISRQQILVALENDPSGMWGELDKKYQTEDVCQAIHSGVDKKMSLLIALMLAFVCVVVADVVLTQLSPLGATPSTRLQQP